MRFCLITLIVLFSGYQAFAQYKKVKTYYKNGKLQSKGVYFFYSNYDKRVPKKYEYFNGIKQKDKEWKYWYQNGQLARIENYKVVTDPRNPNSLRHGTWSYFNEDGVKYREDIYRDGLVIQSVKDIYNNDGIVGKISLQNGSTDTAIFKPLTKGNNLIINPDFDIFFYKPVPIIYEGQNVIEDWLPFWVTPVNCTPDYISNQRIISYMSYHYLVDFELPEKFNFAGIALYKDSDKYSEYIQGQLSGELIKNRRYCFKIRLALSSYSRYSINQLGIHFSGNSPGSNVNSTAPTIVFSDLPENSNRFFTLCKDFIAMGGEKYITLGRFSRPDQAEINPRDNIPMSSFGLENSAYYLIDNVELFEFNDSEGCRCSDSFVQVAAGETSKILPDLEKLREGGSIVLKNVNFDFNSYELLPEADVVLNEILTLMKENSDINLDISGHTDDVGSDEFNMTLSLNRAKSVFEWLKNKGIREDRLTFHGYGKTRPLYQSGDEKLKNLNRRVEIKISTVYEP